MAAQVPTLEPPFKERPLPSNNPQPSSSSSHGSILNAGVEPQPGLHTGASIPLTPHESLPIIFGWQPRLVEDDISAYLKQDLNLSRLNRIHHHLWLCGRPMRALHLHRYKMQGREVVHTQQMDLHLLTISRESIMIKPLPEWILDYQFWKTHICGSQYLHESACGFLLSYVWLVCSPLDLKYAHDNYLLPPSVTWLWWKDFARDFCKHVDLSTLDKVNKRYHFGELSLGWINAIYRTRYMFTHGVRGYLYTYTRDTPFLRQILDSIVIVFVFFSLILSALQVGTGLPQLSGNKPFLKFSYGFTVLSLVSVVFLVGLVFSIHWSVYLTNMLISKAHFIREQRRKRRLARERKDA